MNADELRTLLTHHGYAADVADTMVENCEGSPPAEPGAGFPANQAEAFDRVVHYLQDSEATRWHVAVLENDTTLHVLSSPSMNGYDSPEEAMEAAQERHGLGASAPWRVVMTHGETGRWFTFPFNAPDSVCPQNATEANPENVIRYPN